MQAYSKKMAAEALLPIQILSTQSSTINPTKKKVDQVSSLRVIDEDENITSNAMDMSYQSKDAKTQNIIDISFKNS